MEDLAQGNDIGWKFANEALKGGFQKSTLAPIKQGSSLHGGYTQPRLNTKNVSGDQLQDRDSEELDRKSSTVSTVRSPSEPDIHMENLGATEKDRQKATSPSSIANQRCVDLSFVSTYIIFDRLKFTSRFI
jgi:hypothetical protein